MQRIGWMVASGLGMALATVCAQSVNAASPPACNDKRAVETVIRISEKETRRQLDASTMMAHIKIEPGTTVTAIRSRGVDQQGKMNCAADLTTNLYDPIQKKRNSMKLDITYTIEQTLDGDDFYVTVSGL